MSFICIPIGMNLIKAHGGKGSGPFSFERSATSPPQADHVLVDLFFICGGLGGCVKAPPQCWATFTAILGYMQPTDHRLDTPESFSQIWEVQTHFLSFFFRFYLFIFRERRKEGEREGEKHQCVVSSHAPPTGDLAHNIGMCPDWESNWQPVGP